MGKWYSGNLSKTRKKRRDSYGLVRYTPYPMRQLLRTFYRYWMRFAHVLGWINSRILLTIFFLVVFGPIAIIRLLYRLTRRSSDRDSYWLAVRRDEPTIERLRQIF